MSSVRSTRKRRGAVATPAEQGKAPNEQLDMAKQEEGAKELPVGEKKPEEEVSCKPQSDVTNEAEAKPSSPKKAKIGDEQPREDTTEKPESTTEKVEDATEKAKDATEKAKDAEKVEDVEKVADATEKVGDATEKAKDAEKPESTTEKVEDATEKAESTTERVEDDTSRQETGGKIRDVQEEKPEIATAEQ